MEERVANQRAATSAEAANEDAAPAAKKPRQLPRNISADDAALLAISESPSGTGLRGTLHGDIFQLKLLMLFLVRGIHLKYNFQMSTEMPGQGGKFDDLVFHYQDAPQGEYRYRYVQAKHKQGEGNRITVSDLLNETNGDFSLQKYFRSYRNEIASRGQNVQDCIICTNIGFDDNVLGSKDLNLTLINSDDKILGMKQSPNFDKVPARYKLNITRLDESKMVFKLLHESSEIHQLAKMLLEYANPKNKKKITRNVAIFNTYHVALVKERVIDRETWKFHQDFITNSNLSTNTIQFRDVIFKFWNNDKKGVRPANGFNDYLQDVQFNCSQDFGISKEQSHKTFDDVVTDEQIEDFFNKLVFAVDMPNEVRLGSILTEEVGQHFNLRGCDFQSSFILEKMLDWFKKRQGTDMATLEGNNLFEQTRQKMVALRATAFTIDFRAKYLPPDFLNSFQYQEETIAEKANALKDFLNSPESNKTLRISTRSFRCTTVKILSALETLPEFKDLEDGYLLMDFEHLAEKHMKDWVKGAMKEEHSHRVLVVIGETPLNVERYEQEFMPVGQPRKKMIFICSDESEKDKTNDFERDEFDCKMLSDETINEILSTHVTFQGNQKTLGNLVGGRNGLSEMLDSSSVEEILFHQSKVDIPSFEPQEFEKSLWIERFLLPPPITFDEHFLHELAEELGYTTDKLDKSCKFNPRTNRIKWLIDDTVEKSNIWKNMQTLLLKKKESQNTILDSETPTLMTCGSLPEMKLATGSELKSFFIITGVAGSGKSTALSRHYEHVKAANSNVWVITINLVKHSKYLSKLETNTASDAVDFLVHFPGVTGDGAFARSLLRNRLNNTGGVVLMLDGFDEINEQGKNTIIRLIKAISNGKTKLDRLLITTRPHFAESLQDELFQFAFNLENLGKDHQVEYLMKYWQNKMTLSKEEIARKFANDLIDRVTEALKDKERTFIGIPLQCRILAECFQPQIERLMLGEQDSLTNSAPEIGSNYSVAQLYHMLLQKKRDIFQKKKATGSTDTDLLIKWALDEFLQTIESYHFKLAIDTIFEEKHANLLWPPQQLSDRQSDEDKKEEKMRQYALQFGLTSIDTQNTGKLQFLHRTFAEYLVAEFLYKGFLSDDNKHKDQIRDSDGPLRDFVIRHIFVRDAYEGVRIFLDSMLKDMAITNKTWRDTIPESINQSQPNQLQRFAHHFSFSMSDFLSSGSGAEAFLRTIEKGNVGIFDFMLDCLGAVYDRKSVQEMITKAIDMRSNHAFIDYSVEIHQSMVNFCSDAEPKTLERMLPLMVEYFPFARAKCYSNFPPKARKAYLALLLDFMEKHQKNLAHLLDLELLGFYLLEPKGSFILDQYYDEELRRFMKLVITNIYTSPSSVYYFEKNLDYGDKAMGGRNEIWVDGSIEKILCILKDLKQDKILKAMSTAVLTSNPDLYERIYRPCVFENDRIVELRESALKGDQHAISEVRWQFLAAAVVGNEEVCENMLRILSTDKDWRQLTKLIEYALRIAAMQSADMCTLLIRVVRRHFDRQSNSGQEALRHVLTWDDDVIQGPLIQSFKVLHTVVQMKVTEEEDGSDLFCGVLLGTDSPTEMAKHSEKGFGLLLDHVLPHFNQQQLVKFIRLITSQDYKIEFQGVRCSIWAAEIARSVNDHSTSVRRLDGFLKLVTEQLDQESARNLLLHQENNVVVLYQAALTHGDEKYVDKMCRRYLSQEYGDTVISDFYEKAPNFILDMFDRREMLPYETKITALISFFVDHATDDQFLRFINIITSGGTSSYWEYLFDHLSNEGILKILGRASKLSVGFEEVVRKLLSIDDMRGHDAIIIRAAQQRGDEIIQTVCALLPESSQIEIANFLKCHAPQRIEAAFFSEELHWFWKCNSEIRWNALNFFLNHGNDNQLSEMVDLLTTLRHVDERVGSIWNRCIEELANIPKFPGKLYPSAEICQKLETFLENVNDKIGGDSVIKLLLHKEGQGNSEVVLIRIALLYLGTLSNDPYQCTSRFTLKDTVLSQEKQVELRRLLEPAIDQFKREKCDVNSPFWTSASHPCWTQALHFYLDYSVDPNLSTDFFDIMTYKRQRWGKTKSSIWEYFFGSHPDEVRECFHLVRHVSEKLGEDVVKKLALEKDGNGRFLLGNALMEHANQESVKSIYAFLSTQARNEVIKELLSDPYVSSALDVEIGSRSFSDNTNGELLMYLELVKSVRLIDGKRRSIWTNYVAKIGSNTEKFELLLKLVLDKLGEEYLKQLILHDDDGDGESIISLEISQEGFSIIDAIFSFLSPASQTEVRQKGYTATGLIDRMVSSKGSDYWIIRHLKINSADGTASNLPDGFDLLASYFLDKFNLYQLKNFVKLLTSLNKVKRETRSIWADYIKKVCSIRPFTKQEEENQKFSVSSIDRFFKVVSEKLGTTAVVQLLYHYDSSCVVINYFVLKDCQEIANMAFCQLEQHEKKGKIRFCPINGRPQVEQPIEPSMHIQQRGKKKRDRRANK